MYKKIYEDCIIYIYVFHLYLFVFTCARCVRCVRCVFGIKFQNFQFFFVSENDKNSFVVKLYMLTTDSQNFLCVFRYVRCVRCVRFAKMINIQIANISENGNKFEFQHILQSYFINITKNIT